MKRTVLCLVACLLLPTPVIFAEQPSTDGVTFFEQKIRPVLVQQCYECHSAAAIENDRLEGKLLLDTKAGIRQGGESGPAIVPGDVEASLLISAIRHADFEMPPESKLPQETIANFVKWVEMGAPDPRDGKSASIAETEINIQQGRKFWSFQPLATVSPPQIKHRDWANNKIDHFILARLEAKGLLPNLAVGRRQLIRRAYFDVWGLPPEPEQVDAFVNDSSSDAYEKLVDQLLASPHYGERWARHWLDLARFAESNGYAFDKDRPTAYHYRDFVIKALNEDMSYDRFVRLQIAGDQIEPANPLAHAATGFLAAGPFTSQQTQKERERSRYEQLDDVVGTLGTSMLGLTIGCARCHDHKFDPLPVKDYYRFTATFAATGFQDYDYDPNPAATKAAKEKFDAAHKPLVDARVAYEQGALTEHLDQWLESATAPPAKETLSDWQVIGPFAAGDFKKAYNTVFPPEKKVELDKAIGDLKWTPRPEWKDGTVHNTLTGENSANYLYRTIDVAEKGALKISLGRDDAIKVFLNGKQVLAKEVAGAAAPDQDTVTLQLSAGKNHLLLKIVNGVGPSGFYFSTSPTIPKNIQDIIDLAADKRNDKQKQELLKWYAPRDSQWAKLNQAEQEHLKEQPKPEITKIFAARKNGATYNFGADTRKVYFLARGNSNSKQGLATPGFLQVLTSSEAADDQWTLESAGESASGRPPRVAMAHWLTDHKDGAGHLLARVIVNRLWQHHFGRGIVATPSDFGTQGARPTHPELLDFLANELINGGWKLKPIHKMIMMSSVYQQSGDLNPAAAKADPNNELWWRRGATRLEAEAIRDSLLVVSGVLQPRMFGPGSLKEDDTRRSIYLTVKRDKLIPILQLFDAPDAIQSIGHRNVTTVPPQALAMMNSPLVRQWAEKFALRVRPNGEVTLPEVVDRAYKTALARPPTADERQRMVAFMQSQASSYGGEEPAVAKAVTDFCQLVLCLNEFMFVD